MSTVFFKINDKQATEVNHFMEEEGYTSKAEFFRFLIKFYKYKRSPEEAHFNKATEELVDTLKKLNKEGKLNASLEDQLSDV
jgi:hypothetical protein